MNATARRLADVVRLSPGPRRAALATFTAGRFAAPLEGGYVLHPGLGRVWVTFWAGAADAPERPAMLLRDRDVPSGAFEPARTVQQAHSVLFLTAAGSRMLGRVVPAAALITLMARKDASVDRHRLAWAELEAIRDGEDLAWPLTDLA